MQGDQVRFCPSSVTLEQQRNRFSSHRTGPAAVRARFGDCDDDFFVSFDESLFS